MAMEGLKMPDIVNAFDRYAKKKPIVAAPGAPAQPFVGANTPEMIDASRRMYGGRNPGAGRNPGVQPNVQYGPGGSRVPNPAFYQDVPGAPPPAPPPSNYLPQRGGSRAPSLGIAPPPPPAPLPGGTPAQSERAQQMQAMLDRNPGLQQIYDRNRSTDRPPAQAGTPTGYSQYSDAMRENGGRLSDSQAYDVYKNAPADSKPDIRHTGDQRIGQGSTPLPFEKGPAPKAQPLGGYATGRTNEEAQANFDSRMKAENPFGAFGGTLPVRGADGRPTFAAGPMKEMPQDPTIRQSLFGANDGTGKYTIDSNKKITRGSGFSKADADAADAAKATFDARRGGLEARKAAYESRTASNMSDRKAGVLANAQARKEGRAEKVRIQKGRLTFDERLAMQDPRAAAQKAYGDSQLGLSRSNQELAVQMQKDRLKAQADNVAAQQTGATERAKIANPGDPAQKQTDYSKYTDRDYMNMGPEEADKALRSQNIPAEEHNRRMNKYFPKESQGGHNWYASGGMKPGWSGPAPLPPPPPPTRVPPGLSVPPPASSEQPQKPRTTNGRAYTPKLKPGMR